MTICLKLENSKYVNIPNIDYKDNLLIDEKNSKIKSIQSELKEYEKNPNLYTNKKIITVAAAVCVIAALTYLCWWVATPLIYSTLSASPFNSVTIWGSVILLVSIVAPFSFPSLITLSINPYLFKTPNDLKKNLKKLQEENTQISNKIKSKIDLCDKNITSANLALSEKFSEEAWNAMNSIVSQYPKAILNQINDIEKKKSIWLINQPGILLFRDRNEVQKLALNFLLKKVLTA